MAKIHITMRVDDDIERKIKLRSARTGRPKSEIINIILRKYIHAHKEDFK